MSETAIANIEHGGSIRELRQHFPTKEEALCFYANYMSTKYSAPAAACCQCNAKPDVNATYIWRASYGTKAKTSNASAIATDVLLLLCGIVRIRTAAIVVDSPTHHAFCTVCWRQLVGKRIAANVLHFLGLLIGVICMFIAPLGIAGYFYFRNDPIQPKEEVIYWLLIGLAATVVLGLSAFAVSFAHTLRVPSSLRRIPRFPFRFHAVKKDS